MALILLIETATHICSAAISLNGEIVPNGLLESDSDKAHAQLLAVFIDDLLKNNGYKPTDLSAIAVSCGPGSYTGLRIGVATAKGLAYGLGIPFIAVNTLDALAHGFLAHYPNIEPDALLCPMIDARRMEVYCKLLDTKGNTVSETEAKIIESDSFAAELAQRKVYFVGTGAQKCADIIVSEKAVFIENFNTSSAFLSKAAHAKFELKQFEDTAYYEPLYLKDFIPSVQKKSFFNP